VRELDDRLQAIVQDAYLWIYDRTGVYVATVFMAILLLGLGLNLLSRENFSMVGVLIGLSILSLFVMLRYHEQDVGPEGFNATSREWRSGYSRLWVCIVLGGAIGFDLWWQCWGGIAADILDLVNFAYLWGVLIRKREPPEVRSLAGART
jgi:hypothetical protein